MESKNQTANIILNQSIKISTRSFFPYSFSRFNIFVINLSSELNYGSLFGTKEYIGAQYEHGQHSPDAFLYQNILNYPFLVDSIENADLIYYPIFYWSLLLSHELNKYSEMIHDSLVSLSHKLKPHQKIYFPHSFPMHSKLLEDIPNLITGTFDPDISDPRQFAFPYISQFPQLIINYHKIKRISEKTINFYLAMGIEKHQIRKDIAQILKDGNIHLSSLKFFNSQQPDFQSILFKVPFYLDKAIFTLIPIGHYPSSKRFFDAINYGTIPIVMSPGYIYPFSNYINYSKFVIQISQNEIEYLPKLIKELLKDKEKLQEMQDSLIEAARMLRFDSEYPIIRGGFHLWIEEIKNKFYGNKIRYDENIPKPFPVEKYLSEAPKNH